jgi:hypothetical protein
MADKIPLEYFRATADSEEEAVARYNLYSNRVDSARRLGASGVQVDGGP